MAATRREELTKTDSGDARTLSDWRLAIDIGGTFTDVVLLDAISGRVVVDETLTTPAAPLDGVRTGVRRLLATAGVRPAEITAPIVHAPSSPAPIICGHMVSPGAPAMERTEGFNKSDFPLPPVPAPSPCRTLRGTGR